MSDLNAYLEQKRKAFHTRQERIESGQADAVQLKASVSAEGRSGVRLLRIRDHRVISDSPADFAGYDLGPSSPELQLGVLGTCVTHIFLIQAADQQVPLNNLRVDVQGTLDPRAGKPGHEHTPFWPHDIAYTVHIDSPASAAQIQQLFESVEAVCPILNLLKNPQTIRAQWVHINTLDGVTPARPAAQAVNDDRAAA
ncbi:putative OsmC-like protein [Comamonas sp. BIGb0124]|uniref:OsmC family protein n=1 Tax=Comamonas sp. BIGb0124 TaxID=2485130 RepID=UPI000F48A701|nr:OsmC family protein [Comamonas sp. BIGb0124]ROR24618.1 putative OsmC-like protein [Comamonas sp. BIGb0124]